MKIFCALALLLLFTAAAADSKIVCDETTGICVLTDDDNSDGKTLENAVICDETTGICIPADTAASDESSPTAETAVNALSLKSKLLGLTDVDEFLTFLRNGNRAATASTIQANSGEITDISEEKSNKISTFMGMLLLALLGGLALNLTPCVLPMLPVNLAIIGAAGGKTGFRRGLLYGAGMAFTYGVLGVLAAFAGVGFGSINSSPIFNLVIATIFIILSLGMAGVFTISPGSKLHLNPAQLNVSKNLLALIMGALSAVLAGACVAPVVISVLIFAASTGWYGSLVPFALGLGMALPWPLAGAGLSVLPKPGRFMLLIKYIFAVVIFATGVYYALLGIQLLNASANDQDGFARLEAAAAESYRSGKPILVKFTASWCKNCHAMDRTTLQNEEVKKYISDNYIMVTFPAENPSDPQIKSLLRRYEIPGFPAFVILTSR